MKFINAMIVMALLTMKVCGAVGPTTEDRDWLKQQENLSEQLRQHPDRQLQQELEAQIKPFEGLLLGLFFMAVGMSIDVQRITAEPLLIASGVVVLLAVKATVLFLLGLRPGRLDVRGAMLLAGVLALGGEFAFVVFGEADKAGLLDAVEKH